MSRASETSPDQHASAAQQRQQNREEEAALVKQVLGFCETGETHLEPAMMRNPVSHYTDPAQLEAEIGTLFRQFPLIVAHTSQLAEPGDYVTHDDTGVPLLVTRDKQHNVRAFLNVCRHRGARVAGEPCGKANTFSCPYHHWTYGLDGQLRGLPHASGFGEFDRSQLGLREVPCFERFGLIWAQPSPSDTDLDIDRWLSPMAGQLASLDLGAHRIYKRWSLPRNMSWRLALEGFQESYHFCAAHKSTACSAYLDNQSVFLNKYPHVRHAVPLAGIAQYAKDAKDAKDAQNLNKEAPAPDYRAHFMTQNYLFPCNFAQVMTDHVYIHSIIPTGPGTCLFQCMMLVPEAEELARPDKYWDANYEVVRAVFDEDFEIGENIQKGFAAQANTHFVFGRYEAGLQMGQTAIADALEGRLKVPRI